MKGNKKKHEQRQSAVVVGKAPRMEDVLLNTDGGVETPFNRASLYAFAKANFFSESLDFLAEVRGYRGLCTVLHPGRGKVDSPSRTAPLTSHPVTTFHGLPMV